MNSSVQLQSTVILCGMKHCGKSTHGRRIAALFGCPFFDTDDEIAKNTGKNVRQIYTESGEEAFKAVEAEACRKIAGYASEHVCVIATGGGICNNSAAMTFLKNVGVCIFLDTDEKLSADRIVREAVYRGKGVWDGLPAYIAKENPHTEQDMRAVYHRFFADRSVKYRAVADYTVRMAEASIRENTERIVSVIPVIRG